MKSFEELNVSLEIIKAIEEMGFESPMPIQEEVIPLMLGKKNDIVALAQTGTGKTAAYGVPLIQEADSNNPLPAALVLCPTRELCIQITGDLNDYAKYCKGIKAVPVYGGSSIDTQIRTIKNGVQIIVATPGRMLDLMRRKAVKLKNISRVILDEADEMLNMGFMEDINAILAGVEEGRNTLLFSATMPNEIVGIAKKYMVNPMEITIGKRNSGAANIHHICYTVHSRDKYLALKRIADFNPEVYCIVFCRTRRETQEIADKLITDGYNADSLHGDLSQLQRDSVMQKFRNRSLHILVATDVAARGLDVDDLTHIINYSLPDSPDIYLHRSGRTGRTGKAGISIAIVNMREKNELRNIERKLGKTFEHCTIPGGKEICEKQLFYFIDKMENVGIDHSQINSYLPSIFKKLESLDKEEIITRFVSLEFNRFLEYYKNSKDINANEERGGDGSSKNKRRDFEGMSSEGYARLFINLGKKDGFYPAELIQLINANTSGMQVPIGKIDLNKIFSFFEVKKECADEVIKAMCKARFKGRNVFVERASERKEKSKNDDRNNFRDNADDRKHKKGRGFQQDMEFGRDKKSGFKKKFYGDKNSSNKKSFRRSGKSGNDRNFFRKKAKPFRKRQD